LTANLATKVAKGLIGAFGNLKKVRKFNKKFALKQFQFFDFKPITL
jgi:hypothetical protein